jgi:flagellar hook-associated protein 1 FlgK
MLQNERSSVSGVSIDEEMTNLITYQRAYQASAELVTTVNQMLSSLVTLGQ